MAPQRGATNTAGLLFPHAGIIHTTALSCGVFDQESRATDHAELRPALYAYIGGIVRNQHGALLSIGGIEDHVHVLLRWRADRALSDLMRDLKSDSSEWTHQTYPRQPFGWQEGYAAFSVSASAKDKVVAYIENQQEHHRTRSFGEELRALLDAHGVEYDPRFLPL